MGVIDSAPASTNPFGLSSNALNGINLGLGGAIGGLNPGGGTTTTSGTSNTNANTNQNYNQSGSSTPTYDASTDYLRKILNNQVLQNLQNPTDLTGYESSGAAGINSTGDAQKTSLNQNLASRGLTYSPVAATSNAAVDQNTGNQINSLHNSIPLIQQQLYEQKLSDALGQFKANPFGTSTAGQGSSAGTTQSTTDTNSTSKTTPAGGILGGILGGIGAVAKGFIP